MATVTNRPDGPILCKATDFIQTFSKESFDQKITIPDASTIILEDKPQTIADRNLAQRYFHIRWAGFVIKRVANLTRSPASVYTKTTLSTKLNQFVTKNIALILPNQIATEDLTSTTEFKYDTGYVNFSENLQRLKKRLLQHIKDPKDTQVIQINFDDAISLIAQKAAKKFQAFAKQYDQAPSQQQLSAVAAAKAAAAGFTNLQIQTRDPKTVLTHLETLQTKFLALVDDQRISTAFEHAKKAIKDAREKFLEYKFRRSIVDHSKKSDDLQGLAPMESGAFFKALSKTGMFGFNQIIRIVLEGNVYKPYLLNKKSAIFRAQPVDSALKIATVNNLRNMIAVQDRNTIRALKLDVVGITKNLQKLQNDLNKHTTADEQDILQGQFTQIFIALNGIANDIEQDKAKGRGRLVAAAKAALNFPVAAAAFGAKAGLGATAAGARGAKNLTFAGAARAAQAGIRLKNTAPSSSTVGQSLKSGLSKVGQTALKMIEAVVPADKDVAPFL